MGWPVENFAARVARIPAHGVGLSLDVFSPSVLELCQALNLLEQAASEAMALRALHVELNDESPWLERRT